MRNPIVYVVPLFFVLLLAELLLGRLRGRQTYAFGDTLTSIGLGLSTQVVNVFAKALSVGVYALAYEHLSLWQLPADAWWVWALALLAYDFFYYWNHRLGHEVGVLWASHVVHHSSEEFNYATALRQSSTGFLGSWLFFWPMAVLGIPPMVFVFSAAVSLLYQFWIHTRHIGTLGWFDRWFASPSNHRVHHGRNAYCIDKNYGAILMLWDHLFGTYAAERPAAQEPIAYGILGPLRSFDPLHANLHKYQDLWRDTWRITRWADRLRLWLKPPGWVPPELRHVPALPETPLDARLYRPAVPRLAAGYALLQCVFVFVLGSAFVVFAGQLDLLQRLAMAAWVIATLWVASGTLEGRARHGAWQGAWLASLALPAVVAQALPAGLQAGVLAGIALVGVLLAGMLAWLLRSTQGRPVRTEVSP